MKKLIVTAIAALFAVSAFAGVKPKPGQVCSTVTEVQPSKTLNFMDVTFRRTDGVTKTEQVHISAINGPQAKSYKVGKKTCISQGDME